MYSEGQMKGSAKNYHLHLPSGNTELWKCTVCAGTSQVGGHYSDVLPLPAPASTAPVGFGTDTSGVHGLGRFRPAVWCGWDLWAGDQPAPVAQPEVKVQIETQPMCLQSRLAEVGSLPLSLFVNVNI